MLGQDNTTRILRQYIKTGTALRQSYIFSGPYGSGKTTLGRILARVLLCESPTEEGDPCDKCSSCRSMLEQGNALEFTEVDAATNSGVEAMRKLTEELQYATFSGRRRIYLFDESHQLSTNALDAMLKPLEENIPGSGDKSLVCIFCTTEPEKMRPTILSRCAPAFVIRRVPPEGIAERLAYICEQENIEADPAMLHLLAEVTECHIRDALKAIEGISMLGAVNEENVGAYLHLDLNNTFVEILESLGRDLPTALQKAQAVLERTSPATVYGKLAHLSMLTYQHLIGAITPPVFWDQDRIKALGEQHRENLLGFAARFSTRPARPTVDMLSCDLSQLYHGGAAAGDSPVVMVQSQELGEGSVPKNGKQEASDETSEVENETSGDQVSLEAGKVEAEGLSLGPDSVRVHERAVAKPEEVNSDAPREKLSPSDNLAPGEFCRLLALRVDELERDTRGPQGRTNLGHSRTLPSG